MDADEIHELKMESLKNAWNAAKNNKDYHQHLKKLNEFQLKEIKAENDPEINHVRIVANSPGNRICSACKALQGKVTPLQDEINNPTLPHNKCSCTAYDETQTNFCLCYYEYVYDDEL